MEVIEENPRMVSLRVPYLDFIVNIPKQCHQGRKSFIVSKDDEFNYCNCDDTWYITVSQSTKLLYLQLREDGTVEKVAIIPKKRVLH